MNKVCKVLILIWSGFCLIGLLVGLVNVGTIETTNSYEEAGANIGIAMGIGFWIMLWFFPTVAFALIGIATKSKEKIQVLEKPKLCPHCGKYYTGSPKFCPNCGKEIQSNEKKLK